MQNIHPIFVHFPIALLSVGFLFDFLGYLLKRNSLNNAGWWCQLFGIASIFVTVGTGLLAESTVPHNDLSHEIMEQHKAFALIALGIFVLMFIWRIFRKGLLPDKKSSKAVYFTLGVTAVAIMSYGAHLGGKLVYKYGVGTSTLTAIENKNSEQIPNSFNTIQTQEDKRKNDSG